MKVDPDNNGLGYAAEHMLAIEALEQALEKNEPQAIKNARLKFNTDRKKLLGWLTDKEVDAEIDEKVFTPDPMVASIVEKDKKLFTKLMEMDEKENKALRALGEQNSRRSMSNEKPKLPRKITTKTLSPALIRDAINAMTCFFRNIEDMSMGNRLDNLKIIIESAIAYRNDPMKVTDIKAQDKWDAHRIAIWTHIMETLGNELCKLAEDSASMNQGSWEAMYKTIRNAYSTTHTLNEIRAIVLPTKTKVPHSARGND